MQSLLGVQAVVLPGSVVARGATIGALSHTAMNGITQPGMIHMGSPARPLIRAPPGSPDGEEPATLGLRVLAAFLPALQLLGSWSIIVASLLPAASAAALLSGQLDMLPTAVKAAAITLTNVLCMTWAGALVKRAMLGKLAPESGIKKYSAQNILRMLFWTLDTSLDQVFGQAARGSAWWNRALQARGLSIAKHVYIDTLWAGDYELVSYASGAVVDRGATVFAHLGMYKAGKLSIAQESVALGAGSVVGPRAAVLPGFSLEEGKELATGQLGMTMKA